MEFRWLLRLISTGSTHAPRLYIASLWRTTYRQTESYFSYPAVSASDWVQNEKCHLVQPPWSFRATQSQSSRTMSQIAFEYVQGGRFHNISGQPVPVFSPLQSKNVFPHIQMEPPLFQIAPTTFLILSWIPLEFPLILILTRSLLNLLQTEQSQLCSCGLVLPGQSFHHSSSSWSSMSSSWWMLADYSWWLSCCFCAWKCFFSAAASKPFQGLRWGWLTCSSLDPPPCFSENRSSINFLCDDISQLSALVGTPQEPWTSICPVCINIPRPDPLLATGHLLCSRLFPWFLGPWIPEDCLTSKDLGKGIQYFCLSHVLYEQWSCSFNSGPACFHTYL